MRSKRTEKPGSTRGILKEMFSDHPEDYISPEEIDRAEASLDEELLQRLEEDAVVDLIAPGSSREQEELDDAVRTLQELYAGCVIIGLLSMVVCCFLTRPVVYAAFAAAGTAVAVWMLRDMFQTIERVLQLPVSDAEAYARKRAALRYVIMLAFLVAAGSTFGATGAIGGIVGIFSMKLSAYMQPVLRKLRRKITSKGR